jgi:ribose transport system ATP-binding protein
MQAPHETASTLRKRDDAVLDVRGVTKRFGGTQALRGVDMEVRRGEIHAFLGANGAGKSTLIRILCGIHEADAGSIELEGAPLRAGDPLARISFVHQDLGLIETMTVGENMAMSYGYPRHAWGLIDWRGVDAKARRLLDSLGAPLPLHRPVAKLTQAERSIVAIARALSREVDLLVLDEPTASLPEADVARLFATLHKLREQDVAIIYVTHRLDEVMRIADAATVLRDGRTIAAYRPLPTSAEVLIRDIVGHVPTRRTPRRTAGEAGAVLQLEGVRAESAGPVSFGLRRGEIVGLAGLRGQGHETIGRAVAGIVPLVAGELRIDGAACDLRDCASAIRRGIAFATGRRAEEGLAKTMTVKENLFLNPMNFGVRGWSLRSNRAESMSAREILSRFQVKPADPDRDMMTLSGGNQQKVVLARWAGRRYKVLVLEDPTIGVDIGAKSQIYKMIAEDAASGTACLVVSSDLEELVENCERVLAFSRGRIVTQLSREGLTTEALTLAVSGAWNQAGRQAS